MNKLPNYDAIILGGGKAGKTLAMDLAKSGQKVAMIEKSMLGGTCINVGCIPTKTLIASAKVAHSMNHASEFGVEIDKAKVNFSQVMKRKNHIVDGMVQANHKSFIDSGMDLILGTGTFVSQDTIEIKLNEPENGQSIIRIRSDKIFINTGAKPFVPPIAGIEKVDVLTNESLMQLKELPQTLIILGGGYIGLEMGQMFKRLGAEVHIIEMSETFIPLEDRDVADEVFKILTSEGIHIHLGHKAVEVSNLNDEVQVKTQSQNGEKTFSAKRLLAAVGRAPNTKDLNLAAAEVETYGPGFIKVNEYLETTAPGIWAMGDVKGGPQFTHVSLDDYRIIKHNLSNSSHKKSISNRILPYTVFIDPELARIGLSQQQAEKLGYTVKIASIDLAKIPRAKTLGETKGMMKAVIDAKTHKILGATVLSTEGGEVMGSLQLAIQGELTYEILRDTMFAHPTLVEGFNMLFANIKEG